MPDLLFANMGEPDGYAIAEDEGQTFDADSADDADAAQTVLLGDTPETQSLVVFNPETGEVLEVRDNPGATATDGDTFAREICAYLEHRLPAATARLDGYKAEKAAWQKHIARCDAKIKREENLIAYYKTNWHTALRDFAREHLSGKSKTFRFGLLHLSFRAKPGKLEITDERQAEDYLTIVCPDAVQIKTSLLVSKIPAELRAELPAHSGLMMTPASEVFEIK